MDNKLFEKTRPIPRPTVDSEREIKVYCWFSNLILSTQTQAVSQRGLGPVSTFHQFIVRLLDCNDCCGIDLELVPITRE